MKHQFTLITKIPGRVNLPGIIFAFIKFARNQKVS